MIFLDFSLSPLYNPTMKFKLVFSFLTGALSVAAIKTYQFLYSPIAGVATANSLNDNVSSYALAKFIRDGGVESVMVVAMLTVLVAIWLPWASKDKSNNTPSK